MIATHSWKVGGGNDNHLYNGTPQTAYDYEVGNNSSSTTYNAKIGLMYLSDYGFSASNSYWTETLNDYNDTTLRSNNWMYLGSYEWTISPKSDTTGIAYAVNSSGKIINDYIQIGGIGYNVNVSTNRFGVRPCFYLNSNVAYISGTGTSSDPIRIN